MGFITEQLLGGPCERNQETLTALPLKSTYRFSSSAPSLGGKENKTNSPTFLRGSCGNGTENLCFFCGSWAKKRGLCALTGSNAPQGGGEQESLGPEENSPTFYPAAPRDQHLLMFLEKSMLWWITNELKTAPAGREKGIFCLSVSLSCCSQKGLHWPDPALQRALTPGRSSAPQSWPRREQNFRDETREKGFPNHR